MQWSLPEMFRLAVSLASQIGLVASWSILNLPWPTRIPIRALVTLLAMLQLKERVEA